METETATDRQLQQFLDSYIECALWSSTDNDDEPLDSGYDSDDLAPEFLAECENECRQFIADNFATLASVTATWSQHGHDFWLTRNGHGAGFWDRGYGDAGRVLTDAAHVWGSVDLYVGDDGKIRG